MKGAPRGLATGSSRLAAAGERIRSSLREAPTVTDVRAMAESPALAGREAVHAEACSALRARSRTKRPGAENFERRRAPAVYCHRCLVAAIDGQPLLFVSGSAPVLTGHAPARAPQHRRLRQRGRRVPGRA